jgi:hypothetical protein
MASLGRKGIAQSDTLLRRTDICSDLALFDQLPIIEKVMGSLFFLHTVCLVSTTNIVELFQKISCDVSSERYVSQTVRIPSFVGGTCQTGVWS